MKHKRHGAKVGSRVVEWSSGQARMRADQILAWAKRELCDIMANVTGKVITNEEAIRRIQAIQSESEHRIDLEIALLVGTPKQRVQMQRKMEKFIARQRKLLDEGQA